MPILNSDVDPPGGEFADNVAAMDAEIADIRAVVDQVKLGGGERARDRHTGRGKMLPRERINRLIDPGAPNTVQSILNL